MLDNIMLTEPEPVQYAMLLYHQGMSVTQVVNATGLTRLRVCYTIRNIARRAQRAKLKIA